MTDDRNTVQTHHNDKIRKLISLDVGPFLHQAYREMLEAPVIVVSLVSVVGATVVYSVTGPIGRDDTFSTAQRLFSVGVCTLLSWPFCHSFSILVLYYSRRAKPYVILLACAAAVPFMAVPCSAIAYAVFELIGRNGKGRLWDIYFNVTVWLAACCAVIHYTACLRARLRYAAEAAAAEVHTTTQYPPSADPPNAPHAPDETGGSQERDRHDANEPDGTEGDLRTGGSPVTTDQPVRFLDRLPGNLGRDVIYLNVSGHYVNAVTAEGSGVILMRFADAVAELGDLGMQVHRSYWVARRHITGIFRRDERTMVRITGGHELPVSRTYLTAVRAFIPYVTKGSSSEHPAS